MEAAVLNDTKPGRAANLASHRGFHRVFQPGQLTFGFIAPLEGYPDSPAPTMTDHLAVARQADKAGFSALWLRDVPFFDPSFGDVGQVFDPLVYAGWLAAVTQHIAIGTAGIVMPLRDPLTIAKQATSLDHLTHNRFLLGLSTGDRPVEYPAFGLEFDNRADRFRDAAAVIRAATDNNFPKHASKFYGVLDGAIDLVPKPVGAGLPTFAIGRCGQTIEWLAQNMDGWIWHQSNSISCRTSSSVGAKRRPPVSSSPTAMARSSTSTAIRRRRCGQAAGCRLVGAPWSSF